MLLATSTFTSSKCKYYLILLKVDTIMSFIDIYITIGNNP